MKEFFKVTDLKKVFEFISEFPRVRTEDVLLHETTGRVLAEDIISDMDLPDFVRSTMDGYAVLLLRPLARQNQIQHISASKVL